MISLHPDFYNMTFRIKSGVPVEGGTVGTMKPVAAYLHNGDIIVVGINSEDDCLFEARAQYLVAMSPTAT